MSELSASARKFFAEAGRKGGMARGKRKSRPSAAMRRAARKRWANRVISRRHKMTDEIWKPAIGQLIVNNDDDGYTATVTGRVRRGTRGRYLGNRPWFNMDIQDNAGRLYRTRSIHWTPAVASPLPKTVPKRS